MEATFKELLNEAPAFKSGGWEAPLFEDAYKRRKRAMPPTLTGTPADLITYQRELVRTHQFEPLGRINKIAIAPSENWSPIDDPIVRKWGRLMEFRNQWLPLAQSYDRTILLVPGRMMDKSGKIGLPDLPDPNWRPDAWTPEESQGLVDRPREKDMARMIPQRLEDRAERPNGRLGKLEGTNFLVFQPVFKVIYQPEKDRQLQSQMWELECSEDTSMHPPVCMTLLVDPTTGETIFFGGRYDITANEG